MYQTEMDVLSQTDIDELLVVQDKGFKLSLVALINCSNGSVLAQTSTSPQLKHEEIATLIDEFDRPEESLALTGLYIGGSKYVLIQFEPGEFIMGKKIFGDGDVCITIKKNKLGFMIIGASDYLLPICNSLVDKLNINMKKMMLQEIDRLVKMSEAKIKTAILDSPINHVALIGLDGTIWDQTTNLEPGEVTVVMDEFDNPEQSLALTGLYLGGSKYVVIRFEKGDTIMGKKLVRHDVLSDNFVTVKKTKLGFIIGAYDESLFMCNMHVEKLRNDIISIGL